MRSRPDLAVYNSRGELKVVIDIKRRYGKTSEWATHTRRSMAVYGNLTDVDYFIIATPDRLFMWKESRAEPDLIPPTYEADMRSELAPYYEDAHLDKRNISGYALEILIQTWLRDIIWPDIFMYKHQSPPNWIDESGLLNAVENGRVEFDSGLLKAVENGRVEFEAAV